MTIPPERIRLPETFLSAGDPVDGNPFPMEDARHKVWTDATRRAEEETCRINSRSLSSLTPSNAQDWLPMLIVEKFNVWAERGVHVVWSDGAVRHYDGWLLGYANACIDEVLRFYARYPPPVSAESILINLRNLLGARVQYWKAEARRYRAEQELNRAALPVEVQSKSNRVGGPKLARWLTAEMEKRGHLTDNRLHVLSGLDRKTIKAIRAGERVAEVRLRKLADGLSKEGPSVSVSDIPTD